MKTLKINFLIVALVIGVASAFATKATPISRVNTIWVQTSQGVWEDATGREYLCNSENAICSKSYPEGQTPQSHPDGGIDLDEDGFASFLSK